MGPRSNAVPPVGETTSQDTNRKLRDPTTYDAKDLETRFPRIHFATAKAGPAVHRRAVISNRRLTLLSTGGVEKVVDNVVEHFRQPRRRSLCSWC
jgi:hypothetical protein